MDREREWRVLVTTAGRLYGTFKNFHIGKIPIVVAGPSPITNSCAARLYGDMGHCNCAACDFCGSRERLTPEEMHVCAKGDQHGTRGSPLRQEDTASLPGLRCPYPLDYGRTWL